MTSFLNLKNANESYLADMGSPCRRSSYDSTSLFGGSQDSFVGEITLLAHPLMSSPIFDEESEQSIDPLNQAVIIDSPCNDKLWNNASYENMFAEITRDFS